MPKLKPVPEPEPEPEVYRVDVGPPAPPGSWVEYLRHPTGRQFVAFMRADVDFATTIEALGERVVKHSFGGLLIDQPMPILTAVLQAMNKRRDGDAVDPTSAGA
jgi:hypothetical protein